MEFDDMTRLTLESIAPVSENLTLKLPAVAA